MKVATRDWHPQNHVSFASNHKVDNFTPFTIENPNNPGETQETLLWPDHCVQGSEGAKLAAGLNFPETEEELEELNKNEKLYHLVTKGTNHLVEMYSPFQDPFETPVEKSDLPETLHKVGITDVFVTGLASDYCVKYAALDAATKEGFKTWVIKEAQRGIYPDKYHEVEAEYEKAGVKLISKAEAMEKVKRFRTS